MKKYKLIEIDWIDAQSGFGRADEIDILIQELKDNPTKSKTCGYLLYEDKEIVIVGFYLFDDMVKHWQMIPKKMIIGRKELK